MISYILNSK